MRLPDLTYEGGRMDALDAILGRRSCRSFTGEPLKEEDVEKLLEAMRWAPSAGNCQPWKFYVVRDPEVKRGLARAALGQGFIAEAPVVFVVCAEPERSAWRYGKRGRSLYCIQDTAAAVENLLLAATAMGYGSCWVGAFEEEEVRRVLELPRGLRPVAIVPVGPGRFEPTRVGRRPLEDLVEWA